VRDTFGLTVALLVELGDETARLGPELEDAIYRVVQEALSNVVKHAAADRVEVAIVRKDDIVQVSIRDDGVGFDPNHDAGGFGLLGIRERVGLLGGVLSIESTRGSGTHLGIGLPLDDASPGAGGSGSLIDVA
jgi:signal transduction histidine kinase